MRFNDYADNLTPYRKLIRRKLGRGYSDDLADAMLVELIESSKVPVRDRKIAVTETYVERAWLQNSRPYYNVWPPIWPMVEKLDLSRVESLLVTFPVSPILLRLEEKNVLGVRGILAGTFELFKKIPGTRGEEYLATTVDGEMRGLGLFIDVGETTDEGIPVHTYELMWRRENWTLEDEFKRTEDSWSRKLPGKEIPVETIKQCVRLVACVSLIAQGNHEELIEPRVLADDVPRLTEANKEQLIVKARRRGNVGWDIGKRLEAMPHWRRPHLALRYCGPGGKEPRIVPVRGSVVQRKKLSEVPTGYLDHAEQE